MEKTRKITTLYLDRDLVNRSKIAGINLSKYVENRLRETLTDIEKCRGRDLNARIPTEPDPQSGAFDQSRQPLPGGRRLSQAIFIFAFPVALWNNARKAAFLPWKHNLPLASILKQPSIPVQFNVLDAIFSRSH